MTPPPEICEAARRVPAGDWAASRVLTRALPLGSVVAGAFLAGPGQRLVGGLIGLVIGVLVDGAVFKTKTIRELCDQVDQVDPPPPGGVVGRNGAPRKE